MRVCDLTNNRSVWSDPDPKLKRNVSTTASPEEGSILRDVKHLFLISVLFPRFCDLRPILANGM
jgi:hypothetical protein